MAETRHGIKVGGNTVLDGGCEEVEVDARGAKGWGGKEVLFYLRLGNIRHHPGKKAPC